MTTRFLNSKNSIYVGYRLIGIFGTDHYFQFRQSSQAHDPMQ